MLELCSVVKLVMTSNARMFFDFSTVVQIILESETSLSKAL